MWLHVLAEHTGYDEQELHLYFREQFLGYEPITILDERGFTLKSTTELTIRQFIEYLNRVARVAYYLEVALPYPDEADLALTNKGEPMN